MASAPRAPPAFFHLTMLARRLALVVFALGAPTSALAAQPTRPVTTQGAHGAAHKTAWRAPKPKEPAAPPPSVALSVEAPTPRGPWTMHVANTGTVPLRLVADARLLTFDVFAPHGAADTLPKKKRKATPVVCALPADMRPNDDVDRALVLAPSRVYSETFDPRLYCFGGARAAALVPGATFVAHLGWMKSRSASAPFVVSPFEGVAPAVRAEKEIVAARADIGADDAPPHGIASAGASTEAPRPKAGDDPYPPKLALATPTHIDVEAPFDVPMTVTVKNEGVRSVTLLLRPETLAFEILGPHATSFCSWPVKVGGTVREAFSTLRAKREESVSLLLDSVCPDNTFDQPGLYVVRPRLDTRHADGEVVGISAFAGEIIGTSTTLLRVHRGTKPPHRARPVLDPL